jgi:hypothetical protein
VTVEIDRHKSVGIFHLAEDFFISAVLLIEARQSRDLRLRFGDFIAYQLHAHSIELLLKAYLRGKGVSNVDLKRFGHKLDHLWLKCRRHGLTTRWWKKLGVIMRLLDTLVSNQTFRYYQSGVITLPEIGIVTEMNRALLCAVRRSLKIPSRARQGLGA